MLTIAALVSMESSMPGPTGAKTKAPYSSPGGARTSFENSASPI